MKREVIIGALVFGAFFITVVSCAIAYYYKMKELHRQSVQRHRAALADEKRALHYWDKAREEKMFARNFLTESYRLREEANSLVDQAISLVKERV